MLSKLQVKYIQSLGHKKRRDEEGLFIAEGPKVVDELLAASQPVIKTIYAIKDWVVTNRSKTLKHDVIEISDAELERISGLSTPNQALAVVKKFKSSASIITKNKLTLVLDTIQDPGNLGTIIRISDWFGIENIICSTACADMYNAKVVQASMGSICRVNILYTDLANWLQTQQGIKIYATVLSGQSIATVGKIKEGILIIGNESQGIHPEILKYAGENISIPRTGKAESLNAAVAAGIILSHLK
jgi:TrmH family RNA methyltransferase